MSIRTLAAAAVVAAGTLIPAAGALAAPPQPVPAAPAHRPANYTLTGVVAGADAGAGTITVTVSGGNARAPKASATTVAVGTAPVVVDGVVADLAAVVAGQRVLVKGTQVDGVVTVARVEVTTAG